ncbi:hypothetical protein BZA05DRAFT_465730 [Tricharina praecox]|uniref:uncharacterized protein n=1 Tax=Tricharina praecox TaxID=43433 RepID=UPI002220AF6F|nr:uncharacterized protein BZA05DRAFT_465730 [Tricharina praecox]KAI5855140.1 hypothetical protein BZA05DRAFT_465730 [Tricharina praecox]
MAITPLPPIKTYEDVPYQPPLPSSRSGSEAGSQFDDVPRPTTSENDYEQLLIPQSANVEPILNGFFKAKAEEVYRVENILDYPVTEGIKEYLCKWKGYSDEDNSWEEYDVIKKAKKVLDAFHKRQKNNPAKEDAEQYYVDEILDDRRRKDGYGYDDDTWEPEDNLGAAISLINAYSWRKKLKSPSHSSDEADDLPDEPESQSNSSDAADDGTEEMDPSVFEKLHSVTRHRGAGDTLQYRCQWTKYGTMKTWEPAKMLVTQDCGRIREYLSVALADDPKEVAAHARTLVAEIIDHRIGSDQTCEFEVRWRGESTPRPVWLTEAESWPLIEVISKRVKTHGRPSKDIPPALKDSLPRSFCSPKCPWTHLIGIR